MSQICDEIQSIANHLLGEAEFFERTSRYALGGQQAGVPTHLQIQCARHPSARREMGDLVSRLTAMAGKLEDISAGLRGAS